MRLLDVMTQEQIDIAEANGVNKSTLWKRLKMNWDVEKAVNKPPSAIGRNKSRLNWESKEYVVYRGEEFVTVGTVYEIAEQLGIKVQTAKFYTYDSYKQRSDNHLITLDLLEEDEY